jgi:hypothetical protein
VLLGKVVDDGDDRSAPVEVFSLFLIFPPFDTPLSLQSLYRVATSKPIILFAVKINDGLDPMAHSIQWWWLQGSWRLLGWLWGRRLMMMS